jgi:hypothetical protein
MEFQHSKVSRRYIYDFQNFQIIFHCGTAHSWKCRNAVVLSTVANHRIAVVLSTVY